MSAELTDSERYELGRLVGNGYLTRVGTRSLIDYVNILVAAHVRRALEDAADDATCDQVPPCGQKFCADANATTAEWLRDRAAAVAPRETKD